jgi:hypothetical protein
MTQPALREPAAMTLHAARDGSNIVDLPGGEDRENP